MPSRKRLGWGREIFEAGDGAGSGGRVGVVAFGDDSGVGVGTGFQDVGATPAGVAGQVAEQGGVGRGTQVWTGGRAWREKVTRNR